MALERGWVDPDGEKFSPQVALARRLKIEIAALERVRQVVPFVEQALGCVGVGVDNNGGFVYGEWVSLFGHGWSLRGGLRSQRENSSERNQSARDLHSGQLLLCAG